MENKDGIIQEVLCMSCLCFGRSLRVLRDAKIKRFYLDTLSEIPLYDTSLTALVVCWECEALLKRIVAFRAQVQDSFRILQTYTNENLHECLLTDVTRPPRLKIVNNEPISIRPDDNNQVQLSLKDEVKNDWEECDSPVPSNADYPPLDSDNVDDLEAEFEAIINDKKRKRSAPKRSKTVNQNVTKRTQDCPRSESQDVKELPGVDGRLELKDEVKNEWDGADYQTSLTEYEGSNCTGKLIEVEIPALPTEKQRKKLARSKVKRTKKIVKNIQLNSSKKPQKPKPTDKHYVTIELSYEEMMSERQREAAKESYMQAEYKCESCLIGFNYNRAYEAHRSGRHAPDIGEYICPICKTIIATVDSFTSHYRRHMRRFECSLCQKRAIDRGRIKQHLYSAHNIALSTIKCRTCSHVSHSLDSHIHHLDTHKGRFKCPECVKTFKHRGGLKNHIIAVHELNNNFPCNVCGKVFRWKNSLKRHLEKHESKDKPEVAYCEPCGISFKSVCSYQRHLKNSLKHVTQDQRKYVCDHCNRRFIDKTKLRDHIEDKHLHRTYQCPICLKSSKNRVNLDQHMRNVHKGRPNNKMCHHCGKGFPTKVQLESHMRTHTGERPFICEYCPTTFTQKSNLYKHYRQVHLNIKSKRYPLCKKRKDGPPTPPAGSSEEILGDAYKPVAILRFSPGEGLRYVN
ncbi:hypothetical protein O3G_MSEX011645 [Manduca sexta]|uniref:C2H2-type domain-containing protein n=1 Tax=Manduca sexta TaxID=7130 RepID=A0A921ZMF2_MANSE|nr:hypothetical protein O3G_MSEX011645 [Manduca sexta]